MDVLNKIKSTVSNLGTVLPGNPVTREYEDVCHIGSAGPGLLWKIYRGVKRSTKQEGAIFVLEKKLLDRYSKRDRDYILDTVKKGVAQLTRLRHPSILTVQHPLEESRESIAFATEPVLASLANILGQHENMPVPPPPELQGFELYDVEIKYGLLQIVEGLAFLHNDVKMLHRNICPESIIVNKSGAWKISGFDFSVMATTGPNQQVTYPFQSLDADLPAVGQPNLDFLAPEYILSTSYNTSSDMFSLGALIYAVYNKGGPLQNNCGSLTAFKQSAKQLQYLSPSSLTCVPSGAREYVKMLLSPSPEVRPDAHQLSKVQFFEDVGVKTLQYLDSLYQWDNLQKSQFYKGLPKVLANLPKRVSLQRILPSLAKEYVSPEMVPFVLPNVLLIAEEVTKEEFCKYILPDLIPVLKLQEPVQILLIFLQKMKLLLKMCPPEDIRNHVLPMIYRSLESDAQQIQELCLSIIPSFADLIEYPAMKNALLPRVKKLCLQTNYLSVRVNCLVCLGKLLEHLDKWLVLDSILPMLPQIPSKEPAVLMGILGIYKLAMTHKKLGITKEMMATSVIPFLMPLTIENGLTLNQFNAIMSVVKDMINRVESEHRSKLEQLNSIRQEQRTTLEMTKIEKPQGDLIPDFGYPSSMKGKEENALDNVFQGLGLDSYINHDPLATPSSTPTPSLSTDVKSTSKNNLTLEEKERLAREQEQKRLFQSQSPLTPKTAASKPSTPSNVNYSGPKDLTTSLINSNLSTLSMTGSNNTYNFPGYGPGLMNQGLTNLQANMPVGGIRPVGLMAPSPGGANTTNWPMSPAPTSLPFQVSGTGNSPAQPAKPIDMSSLDNLLPNLGTKKATAVCHVAPYSASAISPVVYNANQAATPKISSPQSPPGSSSFGAFQSAAPVTASSAKNELDDLFG